MYHRGAYVKKAEAPIYSKMLRSPKHGAEWKKEKASLKKEHGMWYHLNNTLKI